MCTRLLNPVNKKYLTRWISLQTYDVKEGDGMWFTRGPCDYLSKTRNQARLSLAFCLLCDCWSFREPMVVADHAQGIVVRRVKSCVWVLWRSCSVLPVGKVCPDHVFGKDISGQDKMVSCYQETPPIGVPWGRWWNGERNSSWYSSWKIQRCALQVLCDHVCRYHHDEEYFREIIYRCIKPASLPLLHKLGISKVSRTKSRLIIWS